MKPSFFRYLKRVGIAISILFNVLLGGNSNQTFSARNWELKRKGQFNLVSLIDLIFFLDQYHCLTSWVYWRMRKDLDKPETSTYNEDFYNGQE
jgi:hypothetical protein